MKNHDEPIVEEQHTTDVLDLHGGHVAGVICWL